MAGSQVLNSTAGKTKSIPALDENFFDVFDFPCIKDEETIEFLKNHGKVVFIIRGPPGTGKFILTNCIISEYPNAVKCSADDYFKEPFAPQRNKTSLKESHKCCHKKVKIMMEKEKHPIIIQNTHIMKFELQPYIDYALEFSYTVIMLITTRKVSADPETLEKANMQGLKADYFANRLKQWQEVVPQYTGWFLSHADSQFVVCQAEKILSSLIEEMKFETIVGSKGDPVNYYQWLHQLFCIATYCNFGINDLMTTYYLSNTVQDVYGKSFKLTILGFIFSKSLVLALVQLTDNMQVLCKEYAVSPKLSGTLPEVFSDLCVTTNRRIKDSCTAAKSTESHLGWVADEVIETEKCSFIALASAPKIDPFSQIKCALNFKKIVFSSVSDTEGNVNIAHFQLLKNGMKYCAIGDGSWLILTPKKIQISSVFTGLYK